MQKDIHPEWYPEAEVVCDGEVVMTVGATQPKIVVDIWSGTHPFYTGEQRLIDTEGQVDRFMRRLRKREEMQQETEEEEENETLSIANSIDVIGLDDRSADALKEEGLTVVGDVLTVLLENGDDALLSIQSVGQKALIDIKRYLRGEGLIE